MLVLVTYDVNTETAAGRKRLRKVAKACVDYGQRVKNSVFECLLDAAQYAVFKAKLVALIDPDADSLRFYLLGNQYKNKVETLAEHPNGARMICCWCRSDFCQAVILSGARCHHPAFSR